MAVTINAICEAIRTTLGASAELESTALYDEMTESISDRDCPRLNVYPDEFDPNAISPGDRTTLPAAFQVQELVVHADLHGAQRTKLSDDLSTTIDATESLITILEAQTGKAGAPIFGLSSIKGLTWTWKRATFRYGDKRFVGGRFTLRCRVF